MRALVLSGAANYGPLQVGAIEAVLAAGYRPELIVGSSAGGINGIFLAQRPSLPRAHRLAALWREAAHLGLQLPGEGELVLRHVRGWEGLLPPHTLLRMFNPYFGGDRATFGDVTRSSGVRAYAVAMALEPAGVRVFGDRPDDRVIDGLMATTAMPPMLPPWTVDGVRYLDGGIVANLPLRIAVERGADAIVAVDLAQAQAGFGSWRGMMRTAAYSIMAMLEDQTAREVDWARTSGIPLTLIRLSVPEGVPFWDFRHSFRLVRAGRQAAEEQIRQQGLPVAEETPFPERERAGGSQPGRS